MTTRARALARAFRSFWPFWWALAAAALGWINGLGPQDGLLMDQITRLNGRVPSPGIVIVAIDDRSIAELGRWPWRRSLHAALLERLHAAGARAVGLDIIFSDEDLLHPQDDAALAAALRRSGNAVLPLRMEQIGAQPPAAALPRPELAAAARGLGHVHVELDADGIARSLFLREGTAGRWWNHWTLELLAAAGQPLAQARWPGERRRAQEGASAQGLWLRDYRMQIPYAGPPGSFARVSYVDVLDGTVPDAALRGRIVLVGATAAGLGDAYPAPVTSQDGIMAGVEISANVLDALQRGITLRRAAPWQNAAFTVVALLLALAALRRLPQRVAGAAIVALLFAALGAAALAQRWAGLQFAPGAALLCLGLSYPLWSWRRLERAMGYLAEEFERTRQGGGSLLLPAPAGSAPAADELERRIRAMSSAAEQLRSLQRFVRQSIDALPDPMLVSDAAGTVLLANQSAQREFGASPPLVGAMLGGVLSRQLRGPAGAPLPAFDAVWAAMDASPQSADVREIQVTDARRREHLLKAVERVDDQGAHAGWIVSLVDVALLLQAQHQREETMRFLSHDMRAPLSSILTLMELERGNPREAAALHPRIAAHAQHALRLADSFVQLARAQGDAYTFDEANLGDILLDAVEQFWARARAMSVTVRATLPDAPCYGRVERALLTRALANLVDNALKYSPAGASVQCTLQVQDGEARIEVRDQGPGIPAAQQELLFRPFQRLGDTRGGPGGAGLGLVFVQTVLLRHNGRIEVHCAPGQGTAFVLFVPLCDA
ncbi:CHASE2 domain-containing protein [Ramlibacter sp. H39-3-26]|uniref:CHASE2 domain-containing protein n=1 Tax=Curvibacter soli TaxID=3031331 RepID=UPI0023DBD308|nr:CHASE2 domain-containing protein [Ramlibacter sp. H39-3-26]MDF1483876.1 CHASE2 domain-containing protein [Ramlibacter sp. H39-3-26]